MLSDIVNVEVSKCLIIKRVKVVRLESSGLISGEGQRHRFKYKVFTSFSTFWFRITVRNIDIEVLRVDFSVRALLFGNARMPSKNSENDLNRRMSDAGTDHNIVVS